MKITLAKTAGFCFGVKRAVDTVYELIESGEKVNVRSYYVYDAYKDISTDDIREAFGSGDYRENLEDLYDEADRKAYEDYENAVGDFDLDDPYFRPVPVRIFENFRKDTDEDIDGDGVRDSGIRVYINRDDINTYCLMAGEDADSADEIVIDRMHADNNGIGVGDKLTVGGESFTVAGLAAFPNYSTLHEKSTDMMFDALTFDGAMTTKDGWDRIKAGADYEYAWLYENSPADINEENSGYISAVFEAVAKIAKEYNLENGFRVVNNCGADGGQTVGHIHFHMLAKRNLAWPPG